MLTYAPTFSFLLYLLAGGISITSGFAASGGSFSKAIGALFNKKRVEVSETGVIDLKEVEITPEVFEKIMGELESLSKEEKARVKALLLSSSYGTASTSKALGEGAALKLAGILPSFPNLVNLELAGFRLEKEALMLLSAFPKLGELQRADLGGNNLDSATAQTIVELLLVLPHFKELVLKGNNLNEEEKESLKDKFEIWKPSKVGSTWHPILDI
jgi:hypothetical protein